MPGPSYDPTDDIFALEADWMELRFMAAIADREAAHLQAISDARAAEPLPAAPSEPLDF